MAIKVKKAALPPKDFEKLVGRIKVFLDEHEHRLKDELRAYIDSQRAGFLHRSDYCCEYMQDLATRAWGTHSFTELGITGIYDGTVQRVSFLGHAFNWCPFCGVKL